MFTRIMVPVDLAHVNRLEKALTCAADLGKLYSIPVIYVGVTTALPSKLAHTPQEFRERLKEFAAEQARVAGIETGYFALETHDPAIDLDPALIRAASELEADLIVVASHIPNLMDYVWPSNGGTLAAHAKSSVLVVRI
ncbi:universal stress protein [Tropicimonas isoalkanivorans]|uniref:Nucleotide-binding universal stress protein, UspA family n=1 Tax=Tropicimonas isoalkanivorans TaxID=441112 RepID=A0A1I1DPB9_9RHOB|nr:universal stress protein [Tropicimonas isoalkanivorans]SFB74898.1 Nucleotide-binding universal stress protein, UspA family [Tropicimonas isoalkanivorans]